MSLNKSWITALCLGAVLSINMNTHNKFPAELMGMGFGPKPGYLAPSLEETPKSNSKSAEEIAAIQQKKKKDLEAKIEQKKLEDEKRQAKEDLEAKLRA